MLITQGGALVMVYQDGSVLLTHGGTEMGQGLHTKMIQVASQVQCRVKILLVHPKCEISFTAQSNFNFLNIFSSASHVLIAMAKVVPLNLCSLFLYQFCTLVHSFLIALSGDNKV